MPLADYYDRAAAAAGWALGLRPDRLRELLDAAPIEITFGANSARSREGRALLDLLVRLLARLYPRLAIVGADESLARELMVLAQRINPLIEDAPAPRHSIVVGLGATARGRPIFVGAEGGVARVSLHREQACGDGLEALGAGAAACLAAARLFRELFTTHGTRPEKDVSFDPLRLVAGRDVTIDATVAVGEVALLGAGAVGEACLWALSRSSVDAKVSVVDPEVIELSNLQRYVLAERDDVGREKGDVARRQGTARLVIEERRQRWQEFLADRPIWSRVLVALDRIVDRRQLAATLPRWIGNAWTQLDDLGLSTHFFGDEAPCLQCLYLPQGEIPDEDDVVAAALGIEDLQFRNMLRQLLYTGEGVTQELLDAVAAGLALPAEALEPYRGRSIRDLYSEGICGGALVPVERQKNADAEMHVPLAHQSALAGVLLAAALLVDASGIQRDRRDRVRVNVLRPLADQVLGRRFRRDATGRCICRDEAYTRAYQSRWAASAIPVDLDVATPVQTTDSALTAVTSAGKED